MKIEKARKTISSKVLNFRIRNSMSIDELSSISTISARTLRRIELSDITEYNPGLHNIVKLSTAMKMPVNKLLGQRIR